MSGDLLPDLIVLLNESLSETGAIVTSSAREELEGLLAAGYARGRDEFTSLNDWRKPVESLTAVVVASSARAAVAGAFESDDGEEAGVPYIQAGVRDLVCPLWPFC